MRARARAHVRVAACGGLQRAFAVAAGKKRPPSNVCVAFRRGADLQSTQASFE
jgi:hypothetical protein